MSDLDQYIDHQRWLMNSGMISDTIKNQLFTYGAIVHRYVMAVDLDINLETKTVNYRIYINKKLINKIEKLRVLSASDSLFSLWRLKRMLTQMKKDEERLDFANILNEFVIDYCGAGWSASTDVIDYDEYSEGYSEEERSKEDSNGDQPSNE